MSSLRLHISEAAADDILEQSKWYNQQSGMRLMDRWESAVTSALLRITRNPRSGALCTFKRSELAGTRRISIPRFPKHLMFYQVHPDGILILRIVHGARDLEALF